MINSMTGYGRVVKNIHGKDITVELKSVNHRFFDFNCKIPKAYGYLEEKCKNLINKSVKRGKIDLYITIDIIDADDENVLINHSLLRSYLAAYKDISEKYNLDNNITINSIAQRTDIFKVKKQEQDKDELWEDVKIALSECINEFSDMRRREGEKLYNDVKSRIDTLNEIVNKIDPLALNSIENYKMRLREKMHEFLESNTIDENRILAEAAIFADKIAVDEETVRIKSHTSQFINMIDNEDGVGCKLNFLIQELNREINTIGSKSSELEISKLVIEFKSELEKIREQVQNIE